MYNTTKSECVAEKQSLYFTTLYFKTTLDYKTT